MRATPEPLHGSGRGPLSAAAEALAAGERAVRGPGAGVDRRPGQPAGPVWQVDLPQEFRLDDGSISEMSAVLPGRGGDARAADYPAAGELTPARTGIGWCRSESERDRYELRLVCALLGVLLKLISAPPGGGAVGAVLVQV